MVWNEASYASNYITYVDRTVFEPLGLPALQCRPTDPLPALSYKSATANPLDFSTVQVGEIWGDMSLVCGSQGWNLSAHQLATFVHGLFQTEKIVPKSVAQQMEDGNFGMYWGDNSGGLESWSHGGYHPAESNNGEINTLAIAFNNGLSIGVIVNSKFNGNFFNDVVSAVKETKTPMIPSP